MQKGGVLTSRVHRKGESRWPSANTEVEPFRDMRRHRDVLSPSLPTAACYVRSVPVRHRRRLSVQVDSKSRLRRSLPQTERSRHYRNDQRVSTFYRGGRKQYRGFAFGSSRMIELILKNILVCRPLLFRLADFSRRISSPYRDVDDLTSVHPVMSGYSNATRFNG